VHPLRARKSAGEIANLRAAIDATILGFQMAGRSMKPGTPELALEGAVIAGFRAGGAEREGFECVIGSGPNSLVLHHSPSSRAIGLGETLVMDIGAEANYYSADLTRTFPIGGRFSPRQREVYDLVVAVQRACEKHVVPGKTTLGELNGFAIQQFRASALRAKNEKGESVTMDRFFLHSIGHSIGLDVHDVGLRGVLEPGMVFTIEPGLYIESEGIGVRVEDDFLVTTSGVERLSAKLPTDARDIERMAARR
jgi:Xaa-Pro aminopeptidase